MKIAEKIIEEYKRKKKKFINFYIGKIMKREPRVNPEITRKVLGEMFDNNISKFWSKFK